MKWGVRVLELRDTADAARELARVGADPAGVAKMRDKAGGLALRVCGLRAPAANILKQELLSVGGDAAVGRGVVNCSVERSDAVVLATRKQLRAAIRKLRPQPFGLRSLAEEIEQVLAHGAAPAQEVPLPRGSLQLSGAPRVMGILNVTPDSFSDGGEHYAPEQWIARARDMVEEGADILDIGGESSRPGSEPVQEEEELRRVMPVVEYLASACEVPISVDTVRPRVAQRAAEAGASIINDIDGFRSGSELAEVVARTGCAAVAMHMRGTPRTMQSDTRYDDLVGEVHAALGESLRRLRDAGVAGNRVILDPGIGFGKSVQGNLVLLQRLREFTSLGCPLLVGASRKAFIGKTLGIEDPKERLEGSLAAAVLAVANGAAIIRAHDVKATRRAVDLAWAVCRAEEE